MFSVDPSDRSRSALRSPLGLLGLAVVAVSLLSFLFFRTGSATEPEPGVILIDRTSDYPGGSPGGVFDTNRTNHMIRNPAQGYMWIPAGGAPPYRVGWFVRPPRAGRYELHVRYASDKSRPGEVRHDDKTVFTALAQTTGDRMKPAWFKEGTIELHEGGNRLGFHSEKPLPNIDAVRLVRLDPN